MFSSARSQRMKVRSKQRLLQTLTDRSLSAAGLLHSMSLLSVSLPRPQVAGGLCVTLIVLASVMLQLQAVSILQSFAIIAIIVAMVLLIRRSWEADGQATVQEQRQIATDGEIDALRQAIQWQRDLSRLASCGSLDELHRRANSQHMAIAGGSTGSLDEYQSHALQMLSVIVALRSTALESLAWRERQCAALVVLWHIGGLLRIPNAVQNQLLDEPCGRLAKALHLDWLVLLAPGSHAPIAPVMTVFGCAKPGATLSPTQLRMAIEALRTEQPLVRPEGTHTLACLPVLQRGYAPMVMVARGAAAEEEATQSMLLLLGDLLAHHYQQASEWEA